MESAFPPGPRVCYIYVGREKIDGDIEFQTPAEKGKLSEVGLTSS